MKDMYAVLQGPCLTEKAAIAQEEKETVVFKVHRDANKVEIRKAVEAMFDVKVENVRTASIRGKKKRVGRTLGRTHDWKKAYVALAEGSIDFTSDL